MDQQHRLVDVNLLFDPMFEVEIIEEDERLLKYRDIDGVKRIFLKEEATIPTAYEWPVSGWESWRRLKEERLNVKNIAGRFPKHWPRLVEEYRNRDYPLAIGGYPQGFFGTLVHLLGYENVFVWYHEEPALVHDILKTFTEIWMAVFEEVLSQVEIDDWEIWEDMSDRKGSMISPKMVREFLLPYMGRVADFVKARGVRHIHLDTDGDCRSLIPMFMEVGVTGMWPFEQTGSIDLLAIRRAIPDLVDGRRDCQGGSRTREGCDRPGYPTRRRDAPPGRLHSTCRPFRSARCVACQFHLLSDAIEPIDRLLRQDDGLRGRKSGHVVNRRSNDT